jgi:electron transfer flavoprotein alpha subunit
VSGVLVLGELDAGALRPSSFEALAAAARLSEQGAGAVTLALIGAPAGLDASHLDGLGVQEIVIVPSPLAHFEAHVSQAALEALIAARRPSVILSPHTLDALAFAPAVAARGRLGFAGDVTGARWSEHGLVVRRDADADADADAERLLAELDFPGADTVLVLLRAGAFEPAAFAGAPATGAHETPAQADGDVRRTPIVYLEAPLEGCARTELVEPWQAGGHEPGDGHDPDAGEVDITKADFLLSIGRGVSDAREIPRLERLARRMGAALSVSGPLVEAGVASRARKVGLSGKTVAPRVYLALGISGAAPHLAGMSRSRLIVAVNTDANARIFDVAHYGAVADLFAVVAELERQLD